MPFSIERNDLALMDVDAVVVPANESLQITGGAGLTVARAAGLERLQAACNALGGCPVGSAVATPGFDLPARVVVHAVGPVWQGGDAGEETLLRRTYRSALACAAREGAGSIAVPLLSAGSFGVPPAVSLAAANREISRFLDDHEADVRLVLFDRAAVRAAMADHHAIAEYIDERYAHAHAPKRRTESLGFSAPAAMLEEMRAAPGAPAHVAALGSPALAATPAAAPAAAPNAEGASLKRLVESIDASFSATVLTLIDERGLDDAQVYKRANMSRQLFSKLRSNDDYRPTKRTALALAVALRLDRDETDGLLRRAGYALSRSSKADVIVEYFIERGRYDIIEINEALFAFDQPLL